MRDSLSSAFQREESSKKLNSWLFLCSCANPSDQTVQVVANGLGTSNYFSFSMFQFTGKSGDLYLHCKLNLCVKEKNKTCAPVRLAPQIHPRT